MSHRRPAAMAQFGRTSTTVGAPFGGAPAPKITSVAMVQAGALLQVTNWQRGFGQAVRRWQATMAKAAWYGGKIHEEDLYL
jgi:hypothetical protein